jgi:hypothetical protein
LQRSDKILKPAIIKGEDHKLHSRSGDETPWAIENILTFSNSYYYAPRVK